MNAVFNFKRLLQTLKNYHFWIILVLMVILIFIYSIWPWREWTFSDSPWKYFPWLTALYPVAAFESYNRLIGSMFMLPIIYATIIFRWKGALLCFLLSMVAIAPILPFYRTDYGAMLSNTSILFLPALVMLAINVELELRRRDKRGFIERERVRQEYLLKILEAQENERRLLAEELHDQSIQTLLAAASYAESIELTDCDLADIKQKAAFIKEKTRSTVDDLRRISIDLRPGVLDDMGLIPALKWLIAHIKQDTHLRVHASIEGVLPETNHLNEVNIFRIVQEALQNIKKHAEATEVYISLEAGANSLSILIKDNGKGFAVPDKMAHFVTEGKLGIIGMRERVRCLGGTFEIHSRPGEGTRLMIEIPYNCDTNRDEPIPLNTGM